MPPSETLSLFPPHDGTLAGALAARAALDPARPFLFFEDRVWSWGAFQEATARAAGFLAGRGVGHGDRVAVMAGNSDATVILFFALARLGAILVPVNPDFGPAEAGHIFGDAEVAAVAVTPQTRAVAEGACQGAWIFSLDRVLSGADQASPPHEAAADADDVCVIIYTSGTTGFPKGAMHSQLNVVLAGEGFVERMHLDPDDRLLCVLPLFHINALFYSVCGALLAGASVVLTPRFSASGFWRLAAASGATEVNLLAALGRILARRPRSEYVAAHALRKVYGAPLPADVYEAFRGEFGIETVIEGYGMTEVPGVLANPFDGPHRIGTMGVPARLARLRVVDDAGRDLPDGEVGELVVKTPIAMKGYHRDPQGTAAAFRDGWFLTGDLVRRDADGYYTYVARKKDIIRRRGENISGAELDRVIGEHPGVAEAAAVAVPAELGEDDILAVIVPRPDAKLSPQEVASWCAERVARVKVPRYVVFVPELPRTPTHRVAKQALRDDKSLLARAVDLGGTRP